MTIPFLARFTKLLGQDAADWGIAICNEAKWPVTIANVYTFAGWFLDEGGGGQNNPMNSSQGSQYPETPGPWNVDHVRDYPSPEIGVQMTVATLENGYYPEVCAALKAGIGLASPSPAVAAELGTWSGGGYHAITPVVVPMPIPIPVDPHGYLKFDDHRISLPNGVNSERNVVINYDRQRPFPVRNAFRLKGIRRNLSFLATRIELNEYATNDPHGRRFDRAWRHEQLEARAHGKRVV